MSRSALLQPKLLRVTDPRSEEYVLQYKEMIRATDAKEVGVGGPR